MNKAASNRVGIADATVPAGAGAWLGATADGSGPASAAARRAGGVMAIFELPGR